MMEPQWLTYGKRLQAIASTGLHFARDQFDRERYEEVEAIANEMLASLADVPIERFEGLVSDHARGYATPKVDVRGALIEENAILLVREQSDGLWTLPGGFADVGLSPARNVEKEIFEEAGLEVSATWLYGVRHKAGSGYPPDVRDFYKMFSFVAEPKRLSREQAWKRLMPASSLSTIYRHSLVAEPSKATSGQLLRSRQIQNAPPFSIDPNGRSPAFSLR